MSNKKIMLALMTGVLGTSLAGCGGANDQAKAGNGGGDSSQAGPAKIKVALETGGLSYVEGSPDLNNDPYVKAVEKMANVDMDLQLIQHQNYSQNMQLLFAGESFLICFKPKGSTSRRWRLPSMPAYCFLLTN
ncbi:hypothetical protein N6H14_32225 [Paenibacillus sp. CC-CFT747]|nr:hypothetical protein N6H14_32225 [Paenibacillus sp. CC-CFT747]